jgi:hypothetical protein
MISIQRTITRAPWRRAQADLGAESLKSSDTLVSRHQNAVRAVSCRISAENSDQEIPVAQRIRERELALENCVEFSRVGIPNCLNKKCQEDFLVIRSDSSCVKIRCQETVIV